MNSKLKYVVTLAICFFSGALTAQTYEPRDEYANQQCAGIQDGHAVVLVGLSYDPGTCSMNATYNIYRCALDRGTYLGTVTRGTQVSPTNCMFA
jgi:hypothetical protein